jgi:cysteine-rich repeat protein
MEDPQGFSYVGCQNRTAPTEDFPNGIACQPWNTQVPHEHPFDPREEENLYIPDNVDIGFHNYCRNPTSAPGGIYCFTMDKAVRFAYCCPLDDPGCPVPGPVTPRPTPKPTMPGIKYNFEGEYVEQPPCGDGIVETPNRDGKIEDCDDGNMEDLDGCTGNCTVEEGFKCEEDDNGKSLCVFQKDNTTRLIVQVGAAAALCCLLPFLYNMWATYQARKMQKPKEGECLVQMPDGSIRKVNMMAAIVRIQCVIRRQKARREMEKKRNERQEVQIGQGVVPDTGVSAGPAKEDNNV